MGPLNRTQRGICIVAAGVIALGVLAQASSNGMEETPWMLGVLAIAALLFISTMGIRSRRAVEKGVSSPDALSTRIVPIFNAASEEFRTFLHNRVREVAPSHLDDGQAALLYQMQTMMDHHFEATACKAAFMLVYLTAQKTDADFASSPAMQKLELAAVSAFVAASSTGLQNMGQADRGEARKLALASAAKEFAQCKVATSLCIANFATKRVDPLDPAYMLIDGDVALAKATCGTLEATYGDVSRKIMTRAVSDIRGPART